MKTSTILFFVAGVSFSFFMASCGAKEGKNELKVDKTTVKAGEQITVTFVAQEGMDKNAWIGIVPSDIEHGLEAINDKHDLSYVYLNGNNNSTLNMVVPLMYLSTSRCTTSTIISFVTSLSIG